MSDFNDAYAPAATTIASLLQVVPALIGAFLGAPVLARELETGTYRYAWTLGFGRWRWTLAKLVPLAIAVAAAAGMFSLLFSWYFQPFFADGNSIAFTPELFGLRGVAFAAWTLAAFAFGALAGMLIRRVVPAIAATLAVYAGLALAAGLYLRQHYAAPLLTSNVNVPGSAWIISQWWTKGGRTLSHSTMDDVFRSTIQQIAPVGHSKAQNRFWPFQWIEGGWLLALSVLLIAATVWLVGRRAT
jgi:hypothetical protein